MGLLDFMTRKSGDRLEVTAAQAGPTIESYTVEVIKFANEMLQPQSILDPLYADVERMAAALGKTNELERLLHCAFQAGKSAKETSLSVMLKGLDYQLQIEAATRYIGRHSQAPDNPCRAAGA